MTTPIKTRHHYIPVTEITPGMVLGETVNVVERGVLSMVLHTGHILSEDNLSQLNAHHAEFICIDKPDDRTEAQIAEDAANNAHRVLEIFRDSDMSDPTLMALFDQVLGYRSQ